jgi:hypothetical protein
MTFDGLHNIISQNTKFFRKDHVHKIKTDHEPNAVGDLSCNLHTNEILKQSTTFWSLIYSKLHTLQTVNITANSYMLLQW